MSASPSWGIEILPLKDSVKDHRPETREWDKHPGETSTSSSTSSPARPVPVSPQSFSKTEMSKYHRN